MFSKMASGVKASLQCWHRGQSWKWPTCPRHSEVSEALAPCGNLRIATWIIKTSREIVNDSWMDPDQEKPCGCLMWFYIYIYSSWFSKHVSWQHRKLHIPRHLRRTPWLVVMGVPVLLTWGGHHLTWKFDWFCIIIGIVYPYLHPTFGQNSAKCSFFRMRACKSFQPTRVNCQLVGTLAEEMDSKIVSSKIPMVIICPIEVQTPKYHMVKQC